MRVRERQVRHEKQQVREWTSKARDRRGKKCTREDG